MNKDQWYNVLEFSRTVNADLSNYDEDGACKCFYAFHSHCYSHLFSLCLPRPFITNSKRHILSFQRYT